MDPICKELYEDKEWQRFQHYTENIKAEDELTKYDLQRKATYLILNS